MPPLPRDEFHQLQLVSSSSKKSHSSRVRISESEACSPSRIKDPCRNVGHARLSIDMNMGFDTPVTAHPTTKEATPPKTTTLPSRFFNHLFKISLYTARSVVVMQIPKVYLFFL